MLPGRWQLIVGVPSCMVGSQGTVVVIIPTFNRRDVLLDAVRSVLGQSYSDLRCVVADNGSTDGTRAALASFQDDRLSVVAHEKPLGIAGARNFGLAADDGGEWVAFLDSDDLWALTKLARQLAAIAAQPEARWAVCGSVTFAVDMRVSSAARLVDRPLAAPGEVLIGQQELRALLKEENHVPGGSSNVIVQRDLLRKVGPFCTDLPTCEDWDMWLRLAKKSAIAYVDSPLVACRSWLGQSSANSFDFIPSAAEVRAKNFPDDGPLPRSYSARWERDIARRQVAAGQRWPAARSYLRAAWLGRAPGQLAYALATATSPQIVEHRLRRLEISRTMPAGWKDEVEQWLGPWRNS